MFGKSQKTGDAMVNLVQNGSTHPDDQFMLKHFRWALTEGATLDDIRDYWNLPNKDREKLAEQDRVFMVTLYLYKTKDEGLNEKAAGEAARRGVAWYGGKD